MTEKQQILERLKQRPYSTLELRNLGFMSCTQRISELIRRDGVPIVKGERAEYDHIKKKHYGVRVYAYSAIEKNGGSDD